MRILVTDSESVESRLRNEGPEAVIHCAGYTALDNEEEEPDRAMQVNRDGTRRNPMRWELR